jgi:hypothetical protein
MLERFSAVLERFSAPLELSELCLNDPARRSIDSELCLTDSAQRLIDSALRLNFQRFAEAIQNFA